MFLCHSRLHNLKWPFLWNANVYLESHLLRYPKLPAYFIHVGSSANLRNIRPSSVYNHYKVPLVQPPACSSDLVLRFWWDQDCVVTPGATTAQQRANMHSIRTETWNEELKTSVMKKHDNQYNKSDPEQEKQNHNSAWQPAFCFSHVTDLIFQTAEKYVKYFIGNKII